MKDSNDGSGGVPPEAPASGPVAPIPVPVSLPADEASQLPPLPPGVMKPVAAKTGTAGPSLVPSTEPSVELAARASAAAPPPDAEAEPAPVSAPPEPAPEIASEPPESVPSVLQVLAPHM